MPLPGNTYTKIHSHSYIAVDKCDQRGQLLTKVLASVYLVSESGC